MKKLFPVACLALALAAVSLLAQGPLTPIANLRGRTDSAGSLMTAYTISVPPLTPLTNIANLKGRTDSAGSLLVTTTTGVGGSPVVVAYGRQTAQVAADANVVTYTVGSSDGTFEVSANVLVTTATTHNFDVRVTYTDEGNTSRTIEEGFMTPPLNFQVVVVNTNGAVPYAGMALHIRAKAATTIVVSTIGTFTTVVYNIEGLIKQVI